MKYMDIDELKELWLSEASDSGIDYRNVLQEMAQKHEAHRRVRLSCTGYNGYNLTAHCDWYVVLDISIRYRQHQTVR